MANQGSTFAVNLFLANVLGRETFGQYGIVLSTVQVTSLVTSLAMGYTATRYLAEYRSTSLERAGRVLAFCSIVTLAMATIVAAGLLLLAPVLAEGALRAPSLTSLLQVAGGACFFSILNSTLSGALAGLERYRSIGRVGLAAGSVYFSVCAGLGWLWGLPGAVVGLLASAAVQTALLAWALLRALPAERIRWRFEGVAQERSILFRFAIPAALAGLTTAPSLWMSQVILSRQANGFAELGLFTAAYNLLTIVLFVPGVANSAGVSVINNLRAIGDDRGYRRVFWANLGWTTCLVLVVGTGMALVAPLAMRAYGADFAGAAPVLLILLAAALPEALTMAMYQVVQSRERMWYGMRMVVLPRDLSLPGITALLAPSLGAAAPAWGYLASRLVGALLALVAVSRIGLTSADEAPER